MAIYYSYLGFKINMQSSVVTAVGLYTTVTPCEQVKKSKFRPNAEWNPKGHLRNLRMSFFFILQVGFSDHNTTHITSPCTLHCNISQSVYSVIHNDIFVSAFWIFLITVDLMSWRKLPLHSWLLTEEAGWVRPLWPSIKSPGNHKV